MRGGVDVTLAAAASPYIAGVALGAYGASTSIGMVAYQATIQAAVPARLRGRVSSVFDVTWNTARLASLAIGGALADAIGVRVMYLLGGTLLLLAAGAAWTIPVQSAACGSPPGPGDSRTPSKISEPGRSVPGGNR